MARRQRKAIKSEINIVPFLDVLLVLVLIFMATALLLVKAFKLNCLILCKAKRFLMKIKSPSFLKWQVLENMRFLLAENVKKV